MSLAKPLLIAIVGAESTGKTLLSLALRQALIESTGLRCAVVPEYLRTWCETEGRTPQPHEQATIAEHQVTLIDGAAATHDLVLCDTTPLMTAVYSELLFHDRSLHALAQAFHLRCDLTLLTALDIPWVADGLQRDGAAMRAAVHARIRSTLAESGLSYTCIAGDAEQRLQAALDTING